ncbi:hypothetical protein B0A52_08594 [Exophiala mesophila]|uniref:Folliculin-interacting protein N-terminal domain-containing protein n=1 Tax=Exophiala mesophila TaxID=212818 RepID=A0A438MTX6_EXOME|nr:hypothetical protein B0A52_08594 [Exophiala mesophila]
MLGRLLPGYGKGNPLESITDESHTRSLLWPEFHSPDIRPNSISPPTTPFGSPPHRPTPFDDSSGLDLNEAKDIQLIVAQDIFGANDRPLLLFDSQASDSAIASAHRSNVSPPTTPSASRGEAPIPIVKHARNRSSTISGTSSFGTTKESETTDHLGNVLDCMFGVSSATKLDSSTKMHFLPGDRSSPTDIAPRTPSAVPGSPAQTRTPLIRSRTATQAIYTHRRLASSKQIESETRDAILITRMFSINLPDAQEDIRQHRSSSTDLLDGTRPILSPQDPHDLPAIAKKPKIVEKKTPIFAVGLICYLPGPETRPGTSGARPSSRASFTPSGTPNSYGSDYMSPWQFLSVIPEHLQTLDSSTTLSDKGVDIIVSNWDVILRSLRVVEKAARAEVGALLQQVNLAIISSAAKAPKGPAEQRTNQRNVYLQTACVINRNAQFQSLIKQTLWRVTYAFRVPRVQTGFGLDNGGHWLDEARILMRISGNKPQNFFLFNLLTAFLGSHTDWLERLGPDWYRKQFKSMNRGRSRPNNLASRTVVICDNRSTARRFIFLLASFLPRSSHASLMLKSGADFGSPLLTPDMMSSSPAGRGLFESQSRRHVHTMAKDGTLTFPRRDVTGLSTSASSSGSIGGIGKAFRTDPQSAHADVIAEGRNDGHQALVTPREGLSHRHKTNATSSTATPNAGTPVPHFTVKHDGYFPEYAIADGEEAGASADLARILRRESTSSTLATPSFAKWGSLISNVSGLWKGKQELPAPTLEETPQPNSGSLRARRPHAPTSVPIQRRKYNTLESMVSEANSLGQESIEVFGKTATAAAKRAPETLTETAPPRLTVDDRDGVIDVDINMPGFVGWSDHRTTSIPPSLHHQSSSVFSDGVVSSCSSRSHTIEKNQRSNVNVAGYLQRYHEDFSLQGLKYYKDLQRDVRQSMLREQTPVDDISNSFVEIAENGDRWVNVCTTLLADVRTFTIQRLTLRRKTDSIDGLSRKATHQLRQTPTDGDMSQRTARENDSEEFIVETVMDCDAILTDAIERVLNEGEAVKNKSINTSRAHSRAVSLGTSDSIKSEPLDIAGSAKSRDYAHTGILSQSDCRHAVVGALEEVVKSVNDDLTKHHRNTDGRMQIDDVVLTQELKQDNVLREGVKKWLLNVETRSVW